MNARERRGKQIAEKPNQVTRINETHHAVKSQSRNKLHDIISVESGWTCSCEDHRFRSTICKHIHAVEISIKMHQTVKEDVVIPEVVIDSCKHCNSTNIIKMGIRHNKNYDVQTFKCKDSTRNSHTTWALKNECDARPNHHSHEPVL